MQILKVAGVDNNVLITLHTSLLKNVNQEFNEIGDNRKLS